MLLKTRFYVPPLRPQCVPRPALMAQLSASQGGELVLIAAPAGYGKTTLVSQWLHETPHTFSWLTLDKSHNVPTPFWHYALEAMRRIQPTVGQEAEQLITQRSGAPDVERVVISLLNDLDDLSVHTCANHPLTLVLDDFHHIEDPSLLASINLFLDHLPPGIRMVLTSRHEPPLELSRRRATNQLREIGGHALRFTLTESTAFFNDTLALHLAPAAIQGIHASTEGWITGLQLISYSLRSHPELAVSPIGQQSPIDRNIADYLFDEVFHSLQSDQQQFLMASALPRRFCAGICQAMVPMLPAQQQIAALEQENLFVFPLDNYRVWYRLHDLFRQFLLQTALTDHQDLMHSAGMAGVQWFQNAGHYDDALALSIRIQHWPATHSLLKLMLELSESGVLSDDAIRLLSTIPDLATHPEIHAIHTRQTDLKSSVSNTSSPSPSVADPWEEALSEPLTRREKQVLTLMTQGLSNRDIADALFISLNTLKVHIRNLYGKFGVENRAQLLSLFAAV